MHRFLAERGQGHPLPSAPIVSYATYLLPNFTFLAFY